MDDFGEATQQFALAAEYLAPEQVQRLNAVGALIDRRDPAVAYQLLHSPFTNEPVTAKHLHAVVGHLQPGVGHEGFADWREERQQVFGIPARRFVRAQVCNVEQLCGEVGQRAVALVEGFHGQQHPPHIRVHDDRVGGLFRRFRAGQRAHLQTVVGVFDRALEARLPQTQPLHAGAQSRVVHHGEHAVEALVRLADQKALGLVEVQHAGGRGLDAHLVFDRAAGHAVALARLSRRIGQELGHDEQRNALGPGRCVRQFGQHQVNDVGAHVVLAGGDEDLAAGDRIAAVGLGHGAGLDDAQVGAAMGFGQAHGAGPLASGELLQIGLLLRLGSMGVDRRHRTVGQSGVHAP
ncbi:hypothetical protein D9M71_304870 [compost metagenome]